MDRTLVGDRFLLASRKTFAAACRVWNAVDTSGRRKINIGVESGMEIVPVGAMSHTNLDCSDEAQSEGSGSGEETKSERG